MVDGTIRGALGRVAAASEKMNAAMPPPVPPARLPRRQVLGVLTAAGTTLLAGCRGSGTAAAPRSTPASTPAGPDPLLTDLADAQRLLAVYDETLRAHPRLAPRLRPLRADHAAHVTALATAIGAPTPAAAATAAPVPAATAAALAALRAWERAAAAARAASAVRASGGRAALLASIAACSASHEAVLR